MRRLRACAAVAAAGLGVLLSATPAFAYHGYSQGMEQSAGQYVGLSVFRPWLTSTIAAGSYCTIPYAVNANPLYQPAWITNGNNWVEIGEGQQCNNFRYTYWGYGQQGAWHSLGVVQNYPGTGYHFYRMDRVDTGPEHLWTWYVDGTVKQTLDWDMTGNTVAAGLESISASNVQSTFSTLNLVYRKAGTGNYVDWAGEDNMLVSTGMCGHWVSPTEWHASEPGPC